MNSEEISVLKRYAKVFDLEVDDFPKDMAGWEDQMLLMWSLATSRAAVEMLKFAIITDMNESDFSFEKFDNLYFHFDDNSLKEIFTEALKFYPK